MESFEDIQRKEFEHLTGEIGALGRRLVELGWSRDQVLAYVKSERFDGHRVWSSHASHKRADQIQHRVASTTLGGSQPGKR